MSDWEAAFTAVWSHREEVLYPQFFGPKKRGIFVLDADVFLETFKQPSIDPRWLHYGVFEFAPTPSRSSWLYVTSGASNPWELEPEQYATSEYSGFGTELVLEVPRQADWAIVVLQRLLAYNILLAHGRYKGQEPLDYGHRLPLGAPITLEGFSALRFIVLGAPEHYPRSFKLESGQVDLLHAAGITESERNYAKEHGSDALVELLKTRDAFPVTNPDREPVL